MSYYDERVARALVGIERELRGIRCALQSIDKRQQTPEEKENIAALRDYLTSRNFGGGGQDDEELRRGVCSAAELDGTPCNGCRPRPCEHEIWGGLGK